MSREAPAGAGAFLIVSVISAKAAAALPVFATLTTTFTAFVQTDRPSMSMFVSGLL
jgi:hypothetical protein